jgi:hypothetical protein
MLILLRRLFINTKEEINKDIEYRVGKWLDSSGQYKDFDNTLCNVIAVILYIASFNLWNCLDIALVLTILDFSKELGNKESVDETLKESEIAPDLESVYTNLESVSETVQTKCPNEQDILQYSNFSK